MMMVRNYIQRMRQGWAGAMAVLIAIALLYACSTKVESLQGTQMFASPQQAVAGLLASVQNNNDAGLLAILGPGAADLISSGDQVADRNARERFCKAYADKNGIEMQSADRAILLVGSKNYPFPIPLVRQDEKWRFDTPAGREEILNRRIGRNELHTIEVLHAFTDAQREYACLKRKEGGGPEFAQRFASHEGARDGLYWPTGDDGVESPFGPLIAKASAEGYRGGLDENSPEPFHGYYFKIITAQGAHANGGAFDYVVDGKMVLGFGLVAYPAKYRSSGVMTFMVNQEGVIYEKDLGAETETLAAAITSFDPDLSWSVYQQGNDHPEGGAGSPGK